MYVHGGSGVGNDVMGDFFMFDIERYDWKKIRIDYVVDTESTKSSKEVKKIVNPDYQLQLSQHTLNTLYNEDENQLEHYIFGGLNVQFQPTNNLYLMV